MNTRLSLPAFSAYGIELEYTIVARDTLDVRPLADTLLRQFAGRQGTAVDHGMLGWSNELVRHAIEVKNVEPVPSLDALAHGFQSEVVLANRQLEPLGARLMPTGMHPWMDPRTQTRLWTLDGREIYAAYNRIFNCMRHGFANLQSMRINLPFSGDAQFARLHAAVRLVLPFIPALAASSPLVEGRNTGYLDYRLEVYRTHAGSLQSITGEIVPETATNPARYRTDVFKPMYREIAPLDPSGVLQHEWLNSRGAIPRFDRNAIEIRVADTQECPLADLAIAAVVVEVVKALYRGRWSTLEQQQAVPTATLVELLLKAMRDAETAIVDDHRLLQLLGMRQHNCTMRDVWAHWVDSIDVVDDGGSRSWWRPAIEWIFAEGTLARRILRGLQGRIEHERIRRTYGELCECLAEGRMFR